MPSSSEALFAAAKNRAAKLQAKGRTVDFKELFRLESDGGTTSIRNVKSRIGQQVQQGRPRQHLVAPDENRPLAFFAGLWTNWTSIRK